jgi:23S rRNA (pseudouridine1915-N3)-methyltransferase
MKIDIIAVGKHMPDWVNKGLNDYLQRFSSQLRCELIGIAPAKRTKNATAAQYKQQEAQRILEKIPPQHYVIALEIQGAHWDTPQLAKQLEQWRINARDVSFIIGGPDGLDESCLARANVCWSLSSLTFPHPLVRIILVEQLYRAWSLLHNHPYHRE